MAQTPLCITLGCFLQQEKPVMVLQDWGEGGKELARLACFELMEVLRISLRPLYSPWLSC